MAALIQGGVAAAAAAYVAYDLLSGPRVVDDVDLNVVAQGLLQANRVHWSQEDDCLYICDSWGRTVWRQRVQPGGTEPAGPPEPVLRTAAGADPTALVRHADGRLLVLLAGPRQVVAVDPASGPDQEPPVVGDVTPVEQVPLVDFVHDSTLGGVYCASFGTQITYSYIWEPQTLAQSIMNKANEQNPTGEDTGPWVVAWNLFLPLGVALSPDGRTLICTQLHTFHLWAWDRDPKTGILSNYRAWAELPGAYCHGLCVDAEGCAWVAVVGSRDDPWTWNCLAGGPAAQYYKKWKTGAPAGGFIRVREGGKVLQRVMLRDKYGVGCALGGPDGHTLYMAIAKQTDGQHREFAEPGNSFVAAMRVAVGAPGSGGAAAGAAPPQQRSRL